MTSEHRAAVYGACGTQICVLTWLIDGSWLYGSDNTYKVKTDLSQEGATDYGNVSIDIQTLISKSHPTDSLSYAMSTNVQDNH